MPQPCPLFFILHIAILAFEWLIIAMLISHMLFQSIYPCKLGATFDAFMFFDAKAMLAFNVVEQMTLFAEAQGAFIAFVCFYRVRHRSSLFIKPQAYLILIYGTIINGRIITFNRISDILLLERVFILFWICCCYSALSLHFIRYFSLWTLYQYFW